MAATTAAAAAARFCGFRPPVDDVDTDASDVSLSREGAKVVVPLSGVWEGTGTAQHILTDKGHYMYIVQNHRLFHCLSKGSVRKRLAAIRRL